MYSIMKYSTEEQGPLVLTIYAPMIYTSTCIMFWMRALRALQGQVGGGWALEIESFFGPLKWHRADRRVHLGPKKLGYARGLYKS
jgi:hypothetical protein